MNELTLEWTESGHLQTYTIQEQQPSKNLGVVRLGRDPARCDVILSHPTVSGLHVEIFFNSSLLVFQIRNLRDSNPPVIDGKILRDGEATLRVGSSIYLGQVELKVRSISEVSRVPPTVLLPPQWMETQPPTGPVEYGLKCSKCSHISPYSQLELGCPWCGTSLAAAVSVVLPPNGT